MYIQCWVFCETDSESRGNAQRSYYALFLLKRWHIPSQLWNGEYSSYTWFKPHENIYVPLVFLPLPPLQHVYLLLHLPLLPCLMSPCQCQTILYPSDKYGTRRRMQLNWRPHTVSAVAPYQFWQAWHTRDSSVINYMPQHTSGLWSVHVPTEFL